MSDYLAVGGVTATLMSLLNNELSGSGPSTLVPAVTAVPPSLVTVGATEEPGLNLFLYYVSLNPALRDQDLPSRDAAGNKVSSPPLALNLHYLVSAYGSTPGAPFTAEILLGWAMKVLHDNPVIVPSSVGPVLTALGGGSPSAGEKLVSGSTLPAQAELLRITPETLTTEEIYRLWPAFQAPYRPSTAFQVSVVVIADAPVPAPPKPQTWVVQVTPQGQAT